MIRASVLNTGSHPTRLACRLSVAEITIRLGPPALRLATSLSRLKRWIALVCMILGPAPAAGQDGTRIVPIPYGPSVRSDQVDIGTLKSLEWSLRQAIPDLYSREELTFAPEIWKMASIHAMTKDVDWTLNADSKPGDFCPTFLTDLRAWKNIGVIEPIARANSFGHESFRPIREACPYLEPHAVVYYEGGERVSGYGLRAFRWFRLSGPDGKTDDYLAFGDAASKRSPAEIDQLGNRLRGPIQKGGTIASGTTITSFDLKICSSERLNLPIYTQERSFSYYFQDTYSNRYPHSTYHVSEFIAIRYTGHTYFLLVAVFGPSRSDPDADVDSGRRLHLIGVSDRSHRPSDLGPADAGPGSEILPAVCSFDAAAGDIERLRTGEN